MAKALTSLSELEAREVSLVKRGANKKRRFPIHKRESQMDPEMIEIIKSLLEEEIEDEAKLVEFIEKQKLGDKQANALKAAMRILNAYKEDGTIKKIMDAMSKATNPFPPKKPEPEPEKADKADDDGDDDADDPDTDPEETDVADDKIPESVQKQLDDANARAEKIEKANEDLKKEVQAETLKRRFTEMIAKCEKLYAHVPGLSIEEQAKMLLVLDDKARELLEKQWAATEEAIVKSALLHSHGTGGGDALGGNAHEKLLAIAKGYVEKSDGSLTDAAAYTRAVEENPDIYQEYLAEHPKQTG